MSVALPASPPSVLRRIPATRTVVIPLRPPKKFLSLAAMMDGSNTKSSSSSNQERDATTVPQLNSASTDLRFDRLQPLEDEFDCRHRRAFGRFIAREAVLDEEYWTAAWLRAESHWEERASTRHAQSFKRQFAEQEFVALKRRCNSQHAEKHTCMIAVKKQEMNCKQTVLSSTVGTLDLSIRHLKSAEMFPGEPVKASLFSSIYKTDQSRYGYVANLCVAKYARRQGIASNMLQLAVEAAKSYGISQTFVHVHKDNMAARTLYDKLGFQMIEMAPSHSLEKLMYLLCFKT